jgi:hypothetical protein
MATRGTTPQRGYGYHHQQERKRWVVKVEAGLVDCARCRGRINPEEVWQLGHTDDRTAWSGPEHAYCNQAAGGRNGAAVTNGKRAALRHSRSW